MLIIYKYKLIKAFNKFEKKEKKKSHKFAGDIQFNDSLHRR